MKRLATLTAVLFLLLAALPALALDKVDQDRGRRVNVVDDVIRMAQAGVSDDAIISYVVHTHERFAVTADDVIALNNAHVSKEVITAMMDEAGDDRRRETTTTRTERVYVAAPYYGWYDPFYSRYYDPFWYGPRVSIGIGFGRGFGHGHFRGGHFRHR